MDRLALVWNFHCGQDGFDLECEKIDFDLESPCGQVGIDLEIILQTCWH